MTINCFQIFSSKPFLIFRLDDYVYKFIDPAVHQSELQWLGKQNILDKYNLAHDIKLEVPSIELTPHYLKMKYVGNSIFYAPQVITKLYRAITSFSLFYSDSNLHTLSLGDAQLRNIYKSNNGFFCLDLSIKFGDHVSIYYDRSRFLVHLIDSNYSNIAFKLLNADIDKEKLVHTMMKRANYTFFKRLKSFSVFSAFYRLFIFYIHIYSKKLHKASPDIL